MASRRWRNITCWNCSHMNRQTSLLILIIVVVIMVLVIILISPK